MVKRKVAKKRASSVKSTPKKSDVVKIKLPKNPWMIATFVLAAALLIILFTNPNEPTVSGDTAGQNVIDFVAGQGAQATLVSVTEEDQFYQVVIAVDGQQVPVYVTKDGENLVPNLVSLTGAAVAVPDQNPQAAPTPTNIPTSEMPEVDLYIMSICPYGTQMEKGLLPVLDALGNTIDFQLKFVSYAMHDKPEIDENTVQYCVQKEYPEKLNDYLYCYLEKQDPNLWAGCIEKQGMNKERIDSCVEQTNEEFGITDAYEDKASWLSGRFPVYPLQQQENQQYGVQGSPTLVINGQQVQSARDSASLLKTICAAFDNPPSECNTELSSASPSPGFGFSGEGDAAAAAGCGIY